MYAKKYRCARRKTLPKVQRVSPERGRRLGATDYYEALLVTSGTLKRKESLVKRLGERVRTRGGKGEGEVPGDEKRHSSLRLFDVDVVFYRGNKERVGGCDRKDGGNGNSSRRFRQKGTIAAKRLADCIDKRVGQKGGDLWS